MDSLYQYNLYSLNATYGPSPRFIHNSRLPSQGFQSLYQVTEETTKAIVAAGTTQGFKGVVWAERLWIDVDSYQAAESTERRLEEMGYDYLAYDTGGRGGHFGVLRSALPSHLLPYQDKEWVMDNFPEADKSIYTHLHPFRIPGTVHEKTGNRKQLVCERRGSALILPPFKKRELQVSTPPSSEGRNESIFSCYRVMRELRRVENGERHYALIRLLYALRDDAGVGAAEALYWGMEWNKLLSEPKTDEEIEKAVLSIYE